MKKIIIFLIFLSVFILGGCIKKNEQTLRPVESITVKRGREITNKTFFAYLKSSYLTDLSFQIEGTLKKIYVKEGQSVKRGQIIAELDAPLYHIQVQEAKYSLSDAVIQYQNAKSYFDRIKKLHAAGGISDNDMDNARTKMESANYQIQIARERLNYMSHRSGYERIVAPTDGIILTKTASEQQYLNPGTSVVQFQSSDDVEAYIFVSQNYINSLKNGQRAKVKIDAIKDKVFTGYIKEMSETSLERLSYRVKLTLPDQTPELKDGMSASAVFEMGINDNKKILIPINSLLEENGEKIVYIITDTNNGTGTVKKSVVKTGQIENDKITIKSGLNDGDMVITKGVSEVQEGLSVKYQ